MVSTGALKRFADNSIMMLSQLSLCKLSLRATATESLPFEPVACMEHPVKELHMDNVNIHIRFLIRSIPLKMQCFQNVIRLRVDEVVLSHFFRVSIYDTDCQACIILRYIGVYNSTAISSICGTFHKCHIRECRRFVFRQNSTIYILYITTCAFRCCAIFVHVCPFSWFVCRRR